MSDRVADRSVRPSRSLRPADPVPATSERLLELDLITRDLAARPGVGCALIAASGANDAAVVLSCGHPGGRSGPGPREFVSRAVRAQRALSEPIDPAHDSSLRAPGADATHAISAPVSLPGSRGAALCVGLTASPTQSDLPWVVDSYARLASLWLRERRGAPLLTAGRDELTGCLTYAALIDKLAREIDRCQHHTLDLTCGFLSLEHREARPSGPALARIGDALLRAVDDSVTVGRYGREQFIVLMPGTDFEAGTALAQRLGAAIRASGSNDACAGVAQWERGTGADRLLGDADRALTVARNLRARRGAAKTC